MNWVINSFGKWYKAHWLITVPVTIGLVLLLSLGAWYVSARIFNGIGNAIFAAKMSWQGRELEKELNSATEQKKEIERTLVELAQSKEQLAAAKREREIREEIFNDKTKTAKEKLEIYSRVMSAAPVHTDATGLTDNDLCARAKAIGSSQPTIDALCAR